MEQREIKERSVEFGDSTYRLATLILMGIVGMIAISSGGRELVAGIGVDFALLFLIVSDFIADKKGLSRAIAFALTITLWGIGVIIIALMCMNKTDRVHRYYTGKMIASPPEPQPKPISAPNQKQPRTRFPCPECSNVISLYSTHCKHCGAVIIDQDKRAYFVGNAEAS